MSDAAPSTVPAASGADASQATQQSALPAGIRTYTPTSYLASLSESFTAALTHASDKFSASLSAEQQAEIVPDFYVAASRAALRAVLSAKFGEEVAAAYAAATESQPSSPLATPGVGGGMDSSPQLSPIASESSAPAAAARKPIRTYIDGCFDIMHSGHYNAIRQAKALTDILVVGVHSDAEILRHKGPPVMNEQERLATVKACKWVDEVVFDTPYDPSLELLIKLNCDFCVHGDDMSTTADGKDAYAEVKEAGRMKVIKRTEGVSTTDLVGRLLLMTKNHHIASPALAPMTSKAESPSFGALSSQISGSKDAPPSFALEPPAVASASPPPKSPPRKSSAASPAPVAPPAAAKHYSSGISNFLPTTWRITQFSNHRTPGPDDRVVYIDGAFDLFHVGHIETLKKAKDLGTFLYVGIHDDATVNLHKGRNYPAI